MKKSKRKFDVFDAIVFAQRNVEGIPNHNYTISNHKSNDKDKKSKDDKSRHVAGRFRG